MVDSVISISSTIFAWAVSTEVTGVLQWIGTAIAVVGIPFTYWKSSQAATAAEKAEKAVNSFRHKSNSVNVAHSYSHLELTKGLIASADYRAAQTVVGILKRDVLSTISFLKDGANQPENLSTAKRNIKTIEVHIIRAARADISFNAQTLDKAITGLGDCLLEWENHFVTTSGH